MPLTIVANIHAKAGREELVRAELEKLVVPTRKEAGCLQYDLHQTFPRQVTSCSTKTGRAANSGSLT